MELSLVIVVACLEPGAVEEMIVLVARSENPRL